MREASTSNYLEARDRAGCELAAEALRSFGNLRLRATGTSMLPAIWPGDVLSIQSDAATEALPGDIVLSRRDGRLVAHRVVERTIRDRQVKWVTRGDSVEGNDDPVSGDDILGKVTAIERGPWRIDPRPSFLNRAVAWVLRRSAFAVRVLLHLGQPQIGTCRVGSRTR